MRFREFNIREDVGDIKKVTDILSILDNPFGLGDEKPDDSNGSNNAIKPPSGAVTGKNTPIVGKPGSISSKEVSSYLSGKMDDNHRIGILANIQGESGFSPGDIGDQNTSGGLFQHHADRFSKLVAKLGSNWASDWKGQIDYALSEPEGKEYLSTRFSSPAEATAWWVKHFERPKYAEADTKKRIGFAKQFA